MLTYGATHSDTYSEPRLHGDHWENSWFVLLFPAAACSAPPAQWKNSKTLRKVHSSPASQPATHTKKGHINCVGVVCVYCLSENSQFNSLCLYLDLREEFGEGWPGYFLCVPLVLMMVKYLGFLFMVPTEFPQTLERTWHQHTLFCTTSVSLHSYFMKSYSVSSSQNMIIPHCLVFMWYMIEFNWILTQYTRFWEAGLFGNSWVKIDCFLQCALQ